jgi:DNA-directed RNA polymerase specialized sigma24 family protein
LSATLTIDTVREAQDSGLTATTAVIKATESRITTLADKAARRLAPAGGDRYRDHRDEFEQVGRVAVWESLSRFRGETVDSFFAFMYATVERTLLDAVRDARYGNAGVDKDAIKVFMSMLERADGDHALAEKFAQSVPPKGQRLSADRANAARLAFEGSHSLDAPLPTEDPTASDFGTYADALSYEFSYRGQYDVPDDLIEPDDLNREDRRVKHAIVHGILDVMGDGQRAVIKHSFGIDGALTFGHGDSGDDDALAAFLRMEVRNLRPARSKGLRGFAKRYVKAVAHNDEKVADELTEAAERNLSAGGRK